MKTLLKFLAVPVICAMILASYVWWNYFPVTSLWRYGFIADEVGFPNPLPKTAKNVQFFYQRGMPTARLNMELPFSDFDALRKSISSKRTKLKEADYNYILPIEVPRDFESYLLSPSVKKAKENLNHPSNSGISFGASRNEVIYWLN
jgi:hypothetical protein